MKTKNEIYQLLGVWATDFRSILSFSYLLKMVSDITLMLTYVQIYQTAIFFIHSEYWEILSRQKNVKGRKNIGKVR